MLDVFDSFERNDIRWAVLRAESSRQEPRHIVDLLVANDDLEHARESLVGRGFLPDAGWRARKRSCFLTYLPAADEWIRLCLSSRLLFGSLDGLGANDVAQVIGRRRKRGALYELDPADAFWVLLLHCLLEGTAIQEADARRLKELAAAARPDGILPRLVSGLVPAGDAQSVISSVRSADFISLAQFGRQLRGEAEARRRATGIGGTARALKWSAECALLRGHGLTVALLAPDGAGKSAVADALSANMPVPVRVIYMGRARTTRGGRRGSVASALARQWCRHLAARLDRFRGRLVLFDRYTYDALLPPRHPKPARIARRWLFAHAVPAPDLVVLLDAPADLMFRRKGEHPRDFLEQRRRDYLDLRARLPEMVVVDAAQDLEGVRRDVTSAIWSAYGRRLMSQRAGRSSALVRTPTHKDYH